jgi:hypothetical protein
MAIGAGVLSNYLEVNMLRSRNWKDKDGHELEITFHPDSESVIEGGGIRFYTNDGFDDDGNGEVFDLADKSILRQIIAHLQELEEAL